MATTTEPAVGRHGGRAARVVAWSLRLFGGIELMALIAVLMPVTWMEAGHRLCGLGEFPDGPLPEYLARSTSLLWAVHGALLLYLSADVSRYAPVIRFIALMTVTAGCFWVAIDLKSHLPGWWTMLEGPTLAVSGVWLVWWLKRSRPALNS